MLPQDQFDPRFDTAVASLAAWAATMRDAAEVTIERTASFWRLRLDPLSAGACPAEVILYRHQAYDVMIGPEAYEGLALDSPDAINPILEALVGGAVTTRTARSAATGESVEVHTMVGPPSNPLFSRTRTLAAAGAGHAISSVKHYLPYRRP
jgi:hypothetical protein